MITVLKKSEEFMTISKIVIRSYYLKASNGLERIEF